MSSSALEASKLDDGSCLLRSSALQKTRSDCEVTVFGYARQPGRKYSGGTDPSNSRPELSGTKETIPGDPYLPAGSSTGVELESFLESMYVARIDLFNGPRDTELTELQPVPEIR